MSTIKIRCKRLADYTLVRTLIAHPMETGKRKDEETGELVPAHFIQTLSFTHNEQLMSECQMGVGVAKNPFFSFRIKSTQPGDTITISWIDNLGYSDTAEHIIR
ncbi:thiosulfate oxidation carrier complex protein SoxZ [Methyloprofundus sp.]|uniref:thiosulfate oxidation carrier complex protein SoxZ n=1 Tax=Methyloprofundus sp. TaxID=2020875 RepID=UPI003D129A16